MHVTREGQVIKHHLYGLGVVTASDTERTAVSFHEHGPKLFVTNLMTADLVGSTPAPQVREANPSYEQRNGRHSQKRTSYASTWGIKQIDRVMRQNIGERIRQLRLASGMTQCQLCDRAKILRRSLWVFETGREAPSLLILEQICNGLGITPHCFFSAPLEDCDAQFAVAVLQALGPLLRRLNRRQWRAIPAWIKAIQSDGAKIRERIRQMRISRGMTQRHLWSEAKISRSTFQRYEYAKRTPSLVTLWKIAKALEVELVSFFEPE
jgi:transcriptional regulator with XRE-family HTH domain